MTVVNGAGRIVSEYVGRGDIACLAALLDEARREERKEHSKLEQRYREEARLNDCVLAQIDDTLRSLTIAARENAGYLRHNDNGGNVVMQDERSLTETENKVAVASAKADSEDATPKDGQRLLALLKEQAEALGFTVDMAGAAVNLVIRQMQTSEANHALMREKLDQLRNSLCGKAVSATERLLIDQVVICCLCMNLTEQYYQNALTDGCSLASASYWERKLSAVQRCYLRAIETLARVRKLMGVPMVQINIATEGGQQVVRNA